ncbi:MAG TPA: apolipoprotein N-acyltransferase [Candidatus Latescibacteria bacterium]|jgi:apolipoprotein N-acyltransferase|nr:apolipoprotein N-acyltransferase [Candidatus Latescibacterota bacterium]HJP33496.1 apolipoprotein N-acyltransferase [Candidatus Latescibacterota bacterium]
MMSSNHTSTALGTPGALLSGVLLALAFPCHPDNPLAPLYSGLWAWIALAPLLVVLATATSRRRAFRLGASTGFLFHLLSLYWIGNTQGGGAAVIAGAILGSAWLSLFTGAFALAQSVLLLRFGLFALLTAPVLWTSVEYLLSLGELGFPWLLLAHSQAAFPLLLQPATVTGAYGVSFAIAGSSTLIAMAFHRRSTGPRWLAAGLAVPACIAVYGALVMEAEAPGDVRVTVVQNNMGLEKWQAGGLEASLASLGALSREGMESSPDLIIWPETAVPCNLAWSADCRRRLRALTVELGTPILTGGPDTNAETRQPYNSAFLFQPHTRDVPSYAKTHLVPFGERTPWRDTLPLLRDIDWSALTGDLGPAEFAPGTRRTLFPVASASDSSPPAPTARFAVLICFESVFPDLVRRSVGNGADFLVIITNDSWFGATAGPYQHAGIASIRAVENRTAIARCATNGISLFIDRFGRTRLQTEHGVAAVRTGEVVRRQGSTFYTRHGDLFAGANLLLSFLLLLAVRLKPPASLDDHD